MFILKLPWLSHEGECWAEAITTANRSTRKAQVLTIGPRGAQKARSLLS